MSRPLVQTLLPLTLNLDSGEHLGRLMELDVNTSTSVISSGVLENK